MASFYSLYRERKPIQTGYSISIATTQHISLFKRISIYCRTEELEKKKPISATSFEAYDCPRNFIRNTRRSMNTYRADNGIKITRKTFSCINSTSEIIGTLVKKYTIEISYIPSLILLIYLTNIKT